MQPAPLYSDVADAPEGGTAYWLNTLDDVRIRIGVWDKGEKGTVLLFPGRTEYVEKYGRTARDFAARGYAMLSIDWRGQGLADRSLEDQATGHVVEFKDYQYDVDAVVKAARTLGLPEPYYLVGHSMGGCIGLRSLIEGLDVKATMFSAPMWGILMGPPVRPAAWALSWAGAQLGFGHKYAPGTTPETYVSAADYENNLLTTDADMYKYMQDQVAKHPELALGGPSLQWLYEALTETRTLRLMSAPDTPVLTFLGSNERIVESRAVHQRMANWPSGRLVIVDGAEHEVLMEGPETRQSVTDQTSAFFAEHS